MDNGPIKEERVTDGAVVSDELRLSGHLLLPDWLPVLRRGPAEIQIGLDSDQGVILTGVPDGTDRLLALLDGTLRFAEVQDAASPLGIAPAQLAWMLRILDSAGLLRRVPGPGGGSGNPIRHPAPSCADSAYPQVDRIRDGRVRLVGSGVLAHAVAANLITAGIQRLYLADLDAGSSGTGTATLQTALQSEPSPTRLRRVSHWSKPDHPAVDLTVVALDTAEPPRAICDDYGRADHRHLFVRPMLGGAIVGPMVYPGRSPCMCCLDHVRRDADPAWPQLLEQLVRRSSVVSPFVAHWAGVTATTQLLAALTLRAPSTTAATIEINPGDFGIRVRQWPMHPECGCAWQD